jgi:hypothetical protein
MRLGRLTPLNIAGVEAAGSTDNMLGHLLVEPLAEKKRRDYTTARGRG